MTDSNNDSQSRDSQKQDERDASQTSGNREESMTDSGKGGFGDITPKSSRTATTNADLERGQSDLDPASSGTTPLGGEPRDGDDHRGPGGVEGEGGNI